MIDWKLVAIGAAVVIAVLVCVTVLALRGIVSPAIAASTVTGALGLFAGWIQPQPRKEKSDA